jgi:hypothetical protein
MQLRTLHIQHPRLIILSENRISFDEVEPAVWANVLPACPTRKGPSLLWNGFVAVDAGEVAEELSHLSHSHGWMMLGISLLVARAFFADVVVLALKIH